MTNFPRDRDNLWKRLEKLAERVYALERRKNVFKSGWNYPVLGGSWTAVAGWPTPAYQQIGDEVYLRGPVAQGLSGQAPYFLPASMCPPAPQTFIVSSSAAGGTSRLQIRADGAVFLDANPVGGAGSFFFTDCNFSLGV